MIKVFGDSAEIAATAAAKPSSSGKTFGWFQVRNFSTSKLPTKIYAWWMNTIQAELLSALAACGLTEDASDDAQLGKCFNKKANLDGAAFTGSVTYDYSGGARLGPATTVALTRTIPAAEATSAPGIWEYENQGSWWMWESTAAGQLMYPVMLPPGVTITGWEVYVYNLSDPVTVRMYKQKRNCTESTVGIGTSQSSTAGAAWRQIQDSLSEVVSEAYEYFAVVEAPASVSQCASFKVFYSQPYDLM